MLKSIILKSLKARQVFVVLAAVVTLNIPVAAVFADDPAACVPPAAGSNGVHYPTGSDASTFVYQCDGAYAGNWINHYYVFEPASSARIARYDPEYSYDCTTNKWTMVWWSYSPASTQFYSSRVTADTTPSQATGCPVAAPAGGTAGSAGTSTNTGGTSGGQSISGTGTGSANGINNTVGLNGTYTNTNNLSLNNGIYSQANTGNAGVFGNTIGGSAGTGDAQSIANIANLLQSTTNVFGPDLTTFVSNINGDVNGDFMFDPSAVLADTGTNSANAINNKLQVNTNNTNNTNAQINNNIDVGAASGDATVANNTNGGSATTGNAQAVVNLVNLINSTVASGKSFLGTININGNLNGDILLPQDFVNDLIAATGSGSTNNISNNATNNSTTTNNTNENVNNAINSSAQTGAANVAGNTVGGSATSGTAGTNVTLLNLTGSSVVGKNNILVFVNVLGHWVGMIMNAPTGSTAASLGGGVVSNTGTGSSNNVTNALANNATTTNNANLGINNNVNVRATSGNANVNGNTVGGNAKSGNANTAVNALNLTGSNLSLSDWFGILFINVFGNWNGSFGVNTSAGDPVVINKDGTSASYGTPTGIQFVPTAVQPGASNSKATYSTPNNDGSGSGSASNGNGVVLAAKAVNAAAKTTSSDISPAQKAANRMLLPIIGAALAIVILLAGERNRLFRRR